MGLRSKPDTWPWPGLELRTVPPSWVCFRNPIRGPGAPRPRIFCRGCEKNLEAFQGNLSLLGIAIQELPRSHKYNTKQLAPAAGALGVAFLQGRHRARGPGGRMFNQHGGARIRRATPRRAERYGACGDLAWMAPRNTIPAQEMKASTLRPAAT